MGIILDTHRAYVEAAATELEQETARLIAGQAFELFWQRRKRERLRFAVLSALVTHRTLVKAGHELAEATRAPSVDAVELNAILRQAGLDYPDGLRGVRDLVNQRDGHLERAREAEDLASRAHEAMMVKYAEAGQLREERDRGVRAAEELLGQMEIDRREHGRALDAVQRELEVAQTELVDLRARLGLS